MKTLKTLFPHIERMTTSGVLSETIADFSELEQSPPVFGTDLVDV